MTDGGRARLLEVGRLRRGRDPQGVVLVLHGGADRPGHPRPRVTQLSVLRMVPVARALAAEGRGAWSVHRLVNSSRGWDPSRTPVEDVGWALEVLRARLGSVPVCLVGHSLGGRAALFAAAADGGGASGVVALNPWLYGDDGAALAMAGRRVGLVHGTADRVADLRRTRRVAADLEAGGADVSLEEVPDGRHAMLSRAGDYHARARRLTREVLAAGGFGTTDRGSLEIS